MLSCMRDMPVSAVSYYRRWLNQYPESLHPLDMERFYLFVAVLLRRSRRRRTGPWLANNLRADCPQLDREEIGVYVERYQTLVEYDKVLREDLPRERSEERRESALAHARSAGLTRDV